MPRQITDAALALIERNEGERLAAYRDVAGVATIGFGHTPARIGDRITHDEAVALLREDVASAAGAVERACRGVPTDDGQFSAMTSLAFNIGNGAFLGSTVLRMHRAGNSQAAADAFLNWSKAHVNGALTMVPGLLRRRAEERAMYLARPIGKPAPAVDIKSNTPVAPAAAQPKPAPIRRPMQAADDSEAEAERLNQAELGRP